MRHEVRHRSYLWYVDLDALPKHRPLARFESRDHVGDPSRSLRDNLIDYLAEQGIDLGGGRITMLANARSLGYVFNPLTLYWCHGADGSLRCVVAEVHNTYRQRHRYLVRTDDAGRGEVAKDFYVSPFYSVDGHYEMRLPEPGERLSLTIALHRSGERPFIATVRGVGRPATRREVLRAGLRRPLETWVVRGLIAAHGVALWRKGLPVHPRPHQPGAARVPTSTEGSMPKPTVADRLASLVQRTAGVPAAELPIRIRAWDGSEAGPVDGPTLVIRHRRALRRMLWAPGELGLARAFVTGDIDVDGDLADGFRRIWAFARSRPESGVRFGPTAVARATSGAARLGAFGTPPRRPAAEAQLSGRLHSKARDRAVIAHHYDLSNEFYETLLDESMAYSCAYFTSPGQSLAEAQRGKLDLVCRKLELQSGMRLLDVGCGWGSLALHAATHYDVSVTAITLSAQQRDHVAKRIADRGLADRVEVRLQDYRDLGAEDGSFDAVSSIEMGEHVGETQYPTYASILHRALRPSGRLLLQQMSRRVDAAPGGGAFIERYIAPDMHMRPLSATLGHLERAGFEVRDVEAMREHYVRTVEAWIATLDARWERFVALQGEQVARVWRLYLVGGALSFAEGRMGVDQFLAVKRTADGGSRMPATRPWALA